jgi:uncharacterized protein (TIGR03435 family)
MFKRVHVPTSWTNTAVLLAVSFGGGAVAARGQIAQQRVPRVQGAAATQAFEVASIRLFDPHVGRDNSAPQVQPFPSKLFVWQRTNLKNLIYTAFGVDYDKILGGPAWVESQEYAISARVEGDALLSQEQMRPLLQNLLEERFHLKGHHEQKIVSGYALVIAKGGSRLQPNKGAPSLRRDAGFELRCQNMPVKVLVQTLTYMAVKRQVVDRTGLEGTYDFDLKYAPDTAAIDDPRFADHPNIFTAVQEQLGLKLVPQKVPVDTFVIDHADKVPTEN